MALVLALPACNRQPPPPEMGPPAVVVATPIVQDVIEYYEYTGTTEAVDKVEVRARVSGYLESMHFTSSTDVEAGALLFVIEPEPYEIAVMAAEADVAQAQAAVDLANLRRDRITEAFDRDAATDIEKQEAEATARQRAAELAAAEAMLHDAELKLSYTQVKSPIAGMVSREMVDVGDLVGVSEPTMLTTVAKMDPIYAYFDVSERIVLEYLERGKAGRVGEETEPPPIEVARANDPEGTFPFKGIIDYVDNSVDQQTGTIRVRGRIDNPNGRLFPGLFIRARAPYALVRNAVLVPEDAVGTALDGKFVITVDENNTAHRQPVKLGQRVGGYVVVAEGLTGDERYIFEGIQKAIHGEKVQATAVDPARLPAPPPALENLPTNIAAIEAEAAPPAEPDSADPPTAGE